MDYLLTFLEGVITFVSPCLLPLLPVYLAYFAGGNDGDVLIGTQDKAGDAQSLRKTIVCALGFVLGFSAIFVMLGAGAGAVGALLVRHRQVVNVTCGAIMVLLGLNYLGVLSVGVLNQTRRRGPASGSRGLAGSVLFGVVFAIGWSPCVGTFLASALGLAASSANALEGVGLLLCYSAGLGLPFVLSAVLVNQLEGAFAWVKRHYDIINKVCGALLVMEGILMACGLFGM